MAAPSTFRRVLLDYGSFDRASHDFASFDRLAFVVSKKVPISDRHPELLDRPYHCRLPNPEPPQKKGERGLADWQERAHQARAHLGRSSSRGGLCVLDLQP